MGATIVTRDRTFIRSLIGMRDLARVRPYAWIGTGLSLVIGSYSVMAIVMAQQMSSAYPRNASDHGFSMWGISARRLPPFWCFA
jgi:hypothetical protein